MATVIRRFVALVIVVTTLSACTTTGHLVYFNTNGERKIACETEFFGAPSVDIHAVRYTLSYCAQQAVAKGFKVEDESLLDMDLSVPDAPNGEPWTFESATALYKANKLTDKEYGYIVANVDLGLQEVTQ
ncbi:MAG: hypothetical protein GJ680_03915 [Alteromonadaceae bacterium]|nr:hypothetical protein [Alteromonadaceae bacterium]